MEILRARLGLEETDFLELDFLGFLGFPVLLLLVLLVLLLFLFEALDDLDDPFRLRLTSLNGFLHGGAERAQLLSFPRRTAGLTIQRAGKCLATLCPVFGLVTCEVYGRRTV